MGARLDIGRNCGESKVVENAGSLRRPARAGGQRKEAKIGYRNRAQVWDLFDRGLRIAFGDRSKAENSRAGARIGELRGESSAVGNRGQEEIVQPAEFQAGYLPLLEGRGIETILG